MRPVITGLIIPLKSGLRCKPRGAEAKEIDAKQTSRIASDGDCGLLVTGKGLGQTIDLGASVNDVITEGEIAEAEAVGEVACRTVDRGGVYIGQVTISVRLEHAATIAGHHIELIMVKGIKGAPVGRNIQSARPVASVSVNGLGKAELKLVNGAGGAVKTVPCCSVCS